MATLGFIGTGNIGRPMARHLVEAGHDLVVHDQRPEALEELLELGADAASGPREVAERCRIVFTSLPAPVDVEAVVRGGLLDGFRAGDIHVDLTTNSVSAAKRMAALEAERGVRYLDAPVTGGVRGAISGSLTVLASGDRDAFDQVEPLLAAFATTVFHFGETGNGTLAKLINNVVVLCAGMLVQEGLVLGAKGGLDPLQLNEALRSGTARPYSGLLATLLERDFDTPTFTLGLATKDVGLCLESARDIGVPMPVAAAAHQVYLHALAAGNGDRSFAATFEAIEESARVAVPKVELRRPEA